MARWTIATIPAEDTITAQRVLVSLYAPITMIVDTAPAQEPVVQQVTEDALAQLALGPAPGAEPLEHQIRVQDRSEHEIRRAFLISGVKLIDIRSQLDTPLEAPHAAEGD